MEIERIENKNLDGGYSEKQQAKDVEAKGFDYKNLRKHQANQSSQKEKILAAYHDLSKRVNDLVEEYFALESENHRHGEKLLEEIKNLRSLQEELLYCMVLASKGQLAEDAISKGVWDLIK